MKRLSLLSALITFLFIACEPAATFDQPQPADSKAFAVFPLAIHGKYLSTDSISVLTISENMMIRIYDADEGAHKDSLGSGYKLTGDTLLNLNDNSKEKITLRGDTVILHLHSADTLFQISNDNVFKKFKGHYFLNKRYSDSAWEVNKVDLQDGKLTIGDISAKEDIEKLNEITEARSEATSDSIQVSMPVKLRMSRKQFTTFVKQKGFRDQESFIKKTK